MYEQLQNDLDHLLLTSQEIAERKREIRLLSELGETIDMTMRMRKWAAQMMQHADDDAVVCANWMLDRVNGRSLSEPRQIEEDDQIQRLAQYFENGVVSS